MMSKSAAALVLNHKVLGNKALGFVLSIWLGGSVLLDFVVMPTLYKSGMMTGSSFASAAEALFSTFNSLEMLMGAIVLAAMMSRRHDRQLEAHMSLGGLALPIGLLLISLVYRYWLTPQIGGLGVQDWLNPAGELPAAMLMMQAGYWLLETVKLGICGILLNRCFRSAI